jgi:hypothetical protein
MGKILVLGKSFGPSKNISTLSAEQVFLKLRDYSADVDIDIVRGMNQVFKILESRTYDKIFLLTHGEWGNDGGIQEVLDLYSQDYTFSNKDTTNLLYDKLKTKEFLNGLDISTTITYDSSTIQYPCIEKPIKGRKGTDIRIIHDTDYIDFSDNEKFIEEFCNHNEWQEYTVGIYNGIIGMPIKITLSSNEDGITESGELISTQSNLLEETVYNNIIDIKNIFDPIGEKINSSLDYEGPIKVDFFIKKDLSEYKIVEIDSMPDFDPNGHIFRSMESINPIIFNYENIIRHMAGLDSSIGGDSWDHSLGY